MKLFEIDAKIAALIDTETGEIADFEAFEALNMEKEQKVENIALAYKNALSDAEALKAEKNSFAEREKSAKANADRLKAYIDFALGGAGFKTPKVNISYRKSTALVVDDISKIPANYLVTKPAEADKTALKAAISDGIEVGGCHIEERQNIQVK